MLTSAVPAVVVLTVVVALAFDLINGCHDAANSIATIVSTRLLTPSKAVAWAAFFNFAALFVFHQGVAKTVASLVKINAADPAFTWVVLAGLLGAIAWNLLTWWLALPSSSSHAIMGALAGAGVTHAGLEVLDAPKIELTAEFVIFSPGIGFVLGGLLLVGVSWILRGRRPARVQRVLRIIRLASAAAYSMGHGGNDAQKTMGIILAVLIAGGYVQRDAESGPFWVAACCYAAMAAGTWFGGWRIIKTLGSRLTTLTSEGAFCAELSGATALFGATLLRIPVSSTHTITGAIVGVGSTVKPRGIRWGLAGNIIWAWILTIPASAAMGAACFSAMRSLHLW